MYFAKLFNEPVAYYDKYVLTTTMLAMAGLENEAINLEKNVVI